MLLTALRLADFRNYAALDFAPAPGLNVFAGPNAQGKSNLLEAIAMLATGKSFRARREIELIRDGAPRAQIAGEARISVGTIALHAAIVRTGSGASWNAFHASKRNWLNQSANAWFSCSAGPLVTMRAVSSWLIRGRSSVVAMAVLIGQKNLRRAGV